MKTNKKTFISAKYLVVFVAGLAVSLFAAYAANTTIQTSLGQAVQYIQKIVLTSDGGQTGTTGVVIDGVSGNVQSDSYCDLSGANCRAITSLLTGYAEADPEFNTNSGLFLRLSDSVTGDWNSGYNWILSNGANSLYFWNNSGNYVTNTILNGMTGNWNDAYDRIQTNSGNATVWSKSGSDVYYTGDGYVGIGIDTPSSTLDVSGIVNASLFMVNGSGGIGYTGYYTGAHDNLLHCLEFKGGILVGTGC